MEQSNKNEHEQDKKKISKIVPALFIAILVTLITHFRYHFQEWFSKTWQYSVLLGIVFLASFSFMMIVLTKKKKEEVPKKERSFVRRHIAFIIISLLATAWFIYYNYEEISSWSLMWQIAGSAAFFAAIEAFLEFFNLFKWFPRNLLNFFYELAVHVAIPTMFIIFIFMGTIDAKYPVETTFIDAAHNGTIEAGNQLGQAFDKLVVTLYSLGNTRPTFWFYLCILSVIIMVIATMYNNFVPKEKDEEDMSAQELIQITIEEDLEKEEQERGIKKKPIIGEYFDKIFYTKKEREKDAKEKLDFEESVLKIYSVDLKKKKEMKMKEAQKILTPKELKDKILKLKQMKGGYEQK